MDTELDVTGCDGSEQCACQACSYQRTAERLEGSARGARDGTDERPSQSTGVSPRQRLEYALNEAGLGRGVTLQSIQRFYRVNTASAMILMVLREACFGVLSSGRKGEL